jgi:hypothetical protein
MESRRISEFTPRNMLAVVKRDPAFYRACDPPTRNKHEQMYYYLMQYNLKHPLYFPE